MVAVTEGLMDFLKRAVTPFHAVEALKAQLQTAGFQALDYSQPVLPGGKYYRVGNGSTIMALVVGPEGWQARGIALAGAHTDSPTLLVKPKPEKNSQGYAQLGVEVYGGALLNPWFDRDLSLAGRVSYQRQGSVGSALVDFKRAIAIIPSLAIHLDREANRSRSINPQTDIVPLVGQNMSDWSIRGLLQSELAEQAVEVDQVLDYELCFYDTQGPSVLGWHGEFLASARLDNLLSCYLGMRALIESSGDCTAVMVCNDHEEVGSVSAVGASGPMLAQLLTQIEPDRAALNELLQRSIMISCDNAHGIHPNFADRHDDNHGPLLNHGPVIKLNSNQRYATNSITSGYFKDLAQRCEVPVQSFVVRSDMACGSTIGPITAGEIGVQTLDIGVPTFAMHSIRELAGTKDIESLATVLQYYFSHHQALPQG